MEPQKAIAHFSDIFSHLPPETLMKGKRKRFDELAKLLQERMERLFRGGVVEQRPLLEATLEGLNGALIELTKKIVKSESRIDAVYMETVKPQVDAFRMAVFSIPRDTSYPTFADLERVIAPFYGCLNMVEASWTAVRPKWAGESWFHDVVKRSLIPVGVEEVADAEPEKFVLYTYDFLIECEDSNEMTKSGSKALGEVEGFLADLGKIVYATPLDADEFSRTREKMKSALVEAKQHFSPRFNTLLSQRIVIIEEYWRKVVPEVGPLLTSVYAKAPPALNRNNNSEGPPPVPQEIPPPATERVTKPRSFSFSEVVGGAAAQFRKGTSAVFAGGKRSRQTGKEPTPDAGPATERPAPTASPPAERSVAAPPRPPRPDRPPKEASNPAASATEVRGRSGSVAALIGQFGNLVKKERKG